MRIVEIKFNAVIDDLSDHDIMMGIMKALRPDKMTSFEVREKDSVCLNLDRSEFEDLKKKIDKIYDEIKLD